MSNRTLNLTESVYSYLLEHSLREPPVFEECRLQTQELPMCNMQISPEQGQFLHLLVKLIGARRILEIGTFTGYSALWMASALPEKSCLIACDVNRDWTDMARRFWEDAGLLDRIELHLGPATTTMDEFVEAGQEGQFDLIFLDADKEGYREYYEKGLHLLRPGGLIVLDNMLWDGKVADEAYNDPDTVAIRALNAFLHDDHRIDLSLLPIGDGLALCRKR